MLDLSDESRINDISFRLPDIPSAVLGYFRIWHLLSNSYFGDVIGKNPKVKRQFLTSYLSRSFSIRERLCAVLHHYRSMRRFFRFDSFKAIVGPGLLLWSKDADIQSYSIILRHNKSHIYEGDLLLTMFRANVVLSQISFSIIPGALISLEKGPALLIGSAQGASPESGEHLLAVKANHGVAPGHLVIAAARSLASKLELSVLVGVGNDKQLSKTHRNRDNFSFDYDRYWPVFGGTRNDAGYFIVPVTPAEVIMGEKSSAHRRRSRKKATVKAEIAASVSHSLRWSIRPPRARRL